MCNVQMKTWSIYMADQILSQNHTENRDEEIKDMKLNIEAIRAATDIQICISIQDIQFVMQTDEYLQQLKKLKVGHP